MNHIKLIVLIVVLLAADIVFAQKKLAEHDTGSLPKNNYNNNSLLYGDIDNDGRITSYDAYNALRMSVGYTESPFAPVFSYTQSIFQLADVDGNHILGTILGAYAVSTYDTYLVLRRSIGITDPFPIENTALIPAVPNLLSPGSGATDISLTPLLRWYTSPTATSYTLQVSTNSAFSSFVYNQSGITATSQAITGLSELSTYYWRVFASNSSGASAYSTVWSFTTTGAQPSPPTLASPANGATAIPLSTTLIWNATPNTLNYSLQVSLNSTFTNLIYYESGLTNTRQTISGLQTLKQYFWRVNASNNYGVSVYSGSWSFTTVNPPPDPPVLTTPANNAIDLSLSPVLIWNASSGAASYNLQVSISDTFPTFVYNQSSLTSTFKQLSGLNYFTKYYWRVRATNSFGTSDWSSPVSAFTTTGIAPAVPVLATPANNAANLSITPTLTWNASPNASNYTIQVSTNSSFASIDFVQTVGAVTSVSLSGLSKLVTYYWRVNASNSYGTSAWSSPVRAFTTVNASPTVPVLVSPADLAVNVSLTPTITWTGVATAASYTLQVSTDIAFASIDFSRAGIVTTSQAMSPALSNLTLYYWRVSAENSEGTSGFSAPRSFTTTGIAPDPPTLLSPADTEIGVAIPTTFTWDASPTATSYSLQVSTNSSFSNYVFSQSLIATTNKIVTGLTISTQYYWRVSAKNAYGQSAWSGVNGFITAQIGPCTGYPTVTYSGKVYNTAKVGSQCWLKENLDVGNMIQSITDQANNSVIEKYCYGNSTDNCVAVGGLYQWAEAVQYRNGATNTTNASPVLSGNIQGVCPVGWHLPTSTEFETLRSAVSNSVDDILAVGQSTGTNASGFSALFAGYRDGSNDLGWFYDLGSGACFWTSNESDSGPQYASHVGIGNTWTAIDLNTAQKRKGCSVRCLKDVF